jgi:hypothetical protein
VGYLSYTFIVTKKLRLYNISKFYYTYSNRNFISDMTQTATLLRPATTWFDRLLSAFILFLALFTIAGPGAANTAMIRQLDTSIGLIASKTPYVVKNFEKIINFGSVNAEAATTVLNVLNNLSETIFRTIDIAWRKALSVLIKKFVDSIFGLFNKMLGAIESWIDTLGALKDTVKSFFGALAMKVYALQECLVNKSSEVVSSLFGFDTPKEKQSTQDACNQGSSGTTDFSKNGDFNFSGATYGTDPNISLGDIQQISNSISNIRVGSLLNFFSQQIIPGTEEKEGPAKDKGTSTQATSNAPSQNQIESQINDTANTIAVAKQSSPTAVANSAPTQLGSGPGALSNLRPGQVTEAAKAKQEIKKVIAQDTAAAQVAKQNVVDAAPADCKFDNFISDTGSADYNFSPVNGFPTDSTFIAGSDSNFNLSNATAVVGQANSFDVNVLTAEQCKSAERVSFTQTAAQAQQGQSGDNGFDIDSLIDSLTKTLTDMINNLISKVFNMLLSVVTKFLSSIPGGEFLSQAFSEAFSGISSAVQKSVSEISSIYGDKLKKATK